MIKDPFDNEVRASSSLDSYYEHVQLGHYSSPWSRGLRLPIASFHGSVKSLLQYLDNIELISRYESIVGVDTPVTRKALAGMPASSVSSRADSIRKRWANA